MSLCPFTCHLFNRTDCFSTTLNFLVCATDDVCVPVYGVDTEQIAGLAGVSSLVDTAGRAHAPRRELITLLATARKGRGSKNHSRSTWGWWFYIHLTLCTHHLIPLPLYTVITLSSWSCDHGIVFAQVAKVPTALAQEVQLPFAPIFLQFHVTICLPVNFA